MSDITNLYSITCSNPSDDPIYKICIKNCSSYAVISNFEPDIEKGTLYSSTFPVKEI